MSELTEFNEERQQTFQKLTEKGLSKKDAALMAGYGPGYVPQQKPTKRIQEALTKLGVTDELVAQKLREGLEAKSRYGVSDHNAITKYLSLLGKWLGYEKDNLNISVGLNIKGQVMDENKLKDAIGVIEAELVNRDSSGLSEQNKEPQ